MNASSESGLWPTWIVRVMDLVSEALSPASGRGQGGVDIGTVPGVFVQAAREFAAFGIEQPALEHGALRVIAASVGNGRGEEEAEEVPGRRLENCVGLGLCHIELPADLSHPPVIVPPVGVQRA